MDKMATDLHEGTLRYTYSSSSFSGWVSQYEMPEAMVVTGASFYVKARDTAVNEIRFSIALDSREDASKVYEVTLSVNIEPETEQLVSCQIPSIRLEKGRVVFICVECDAICSQGFGSKNDEERVSWYSTNGAHIPLEKYAYGSICTLPAITPRRSVPTFWKRVWMRQRPVSLGWRNPQGNLRSCMTRLGGKKCWRTSRISCR